MKTLKSSIRNIVLGFGLLGLLLAAKVYAGYFTDSVSTSGSVYSSGTVYGVPSGATVEWVSYGSTQIGLTGGGLNVFQYGQDIWGIENTTQSDNLDYTLYAYVSGSNYLALHVSW